MVNPEIGFSKIKLFFEQCWLFLQINYWDLLKKECASHIKEKMVLSGLKSSTLS